MLGANFVNARNNETDRQRKMRSENLATYNAFVKTQSEIGAKVTPDELQNFSRGMSASNYQLNGMPSLTSQQNTARAINAAVAQTETTRANTNATATYQRAATETKLFEDGVTSEKPTTPEAWERLQKKLELAGMSKATFDAMKYDAPRLIEKAWADEATKGMTNLSNLGLTTFASAERFLENYPEQVKKQIGATLKAQDKVIADAASAVAFNTNASQTAFAGYLVQSNTLEGGLTLLKAANANSKDMTEAAKVQSLLNYDIYFKGQAVGRLNDAAKEVATILDSEIIRVLAYQDPAQQDAWAKGIIDGLIKTHNLEDTSEIRNRLHEALNVRGDPQREKSRSDQLETARAQIVAIGGSPTDALNDDLTKVFNEADAEKFANLLAGVDTKRMEKTYKDKLLASVINAAQTARGDAEGAFNEIISGTNSADVVARVQALGAFANPMSELDVFNKIRVEHNLPEFMGLNDVAFIEASKLFRSTMRASAVELQRVTHTQNLALAQAEAGERKTKQKADFDATKRDENSPVMQAMYVLSTDYDLGTGGVSAARAVIERMITDMGGDDVFKIEGNTAQGKVNELVSRAVSAQGYTPMSLAVSARMRAMQNTAPMGEEWRHIPPGTDISTYWLDSVAPLEAKIKALVSNVEIMPTTTWGEDVSVAKGNMEEIREALTNTLDELNKVATLTNAAYVLNSSSGDLKIDSPRLQVEMQNRIEGLLAKLASAVPLGKAETAINNGDGTWTISTGDPRFDPGTYTNETTPDGVAQPGMLISSASTGTPGAAPAPAPGFMKVDPTRSALNNSVVEQLNKAKISSTLEKVISLIDGGKFGRPPGWIDQTIGGIWRPRPTDEEQAVTAKLQRIKDNIYGDSWMGGIFSDGPLALYLRQNPRELEAFESDPVGWFDQATAAQKFQSR
jgi:hypothetical protein